MGTYNIPDNASIGVVGDGVNVTIGAIGEGAQGTVITNNSSKQEKGSASASAAAEGETKRGRHAR